MPSPAHKPIQSSDFSRMSPAARAGLLADLERHYFVPRYACTPYEPSALVALALAQLPKRPQVAEALSRCTRQWSESALYTWFTDPKASDRKHCAGGFFLHCPQLGTLLFDTDAAGEILGMEHWALLWQKEEPCKEPYPALHAAYWSGVEGAGDIAKPFEKSPSPPSPSAPGHAPLRVVR